MLFQAKKDTALVETIEKTARHVHGQRAQQSKCQAKYRAEICNITGLCCLRSLTHDPPHETVRDSKRMLVLVA